MNEVFKDIRLKIYSKSNLSYKMSLKEGSVNARDQYKYRSSHDARIHFGLTHEKPIKIPEESFIFGKVTRAQTPFKGIISGDYGVEAGKDL